MSELNTNLLEKGTDLMDKYFLKAHLLLVGDSKARSDQVSVSYSFSYHLKR